MAYPDPGDAITSSSLAAALRAGYQPGAVLAGRLSPDEALSTGAVTIDGSQFTEGLMVLRAGAWWSSDLTSSVNDVLRYTLVS